MLIDSSWYTRQKKCHWTQAHESMEQSNKLIPLSSWNRLVNWNILNLFNQSFWPASTELHLLFDVYPLTHLIYQVKCFTFFNSVQSLSHVRLFVTPWIAACLASLSITNSQSLLKLMSIQPSHPLSSPSPPDFNLLLGSFLSSQFFALDDQSIGVSASSLVLPMNIQDWFPLQWTSWISLQSKGLSRVFSNTTVQKHQFFGTQLSL